MLGPEWLFTEVSDDEEDADVPKDDEQERGADPGASADDDATLTAALAAMERDDDGDQADEEMYASGRAAE